MTPQSVMFHNKTKARVMAQIFAGRDYFSTIFVDPHTTRTLLAESYPYDIYCKDAISGREVGRQLNSSDTSITLQSENGRYVVKGDNQ